MLFCTQEFDGWTAEVSDSGREYKVGLCIKPPNSSKIREAGYAPAHWLATGTSLDVLLLLT